MTGSRHITLPHTVALVAAIMAAVFAGSALGAVDRPAASFYTPQQLEAISQSWAARGGVFVDRPAASFYTPQQLEAISQSWAARGGVFDPGTTTTIGRDGFDWRDFGIGAGAMLGLVLLGAGLAAAVYFGRHHGARPRPAS